ncbi:MAG: hypothetical protein ACREOQ_00435, partial [Gemmatimonadales bacterium]
MDHSALNLLRLTPRDTAILALVYFYDGIIIDLIVRRFWPSPGARSACYDRVARLINAGYLRAERLPSQTGLGSGKQFLTVGPKARPILIEQYGVSPPELRHLDRDVTPLFAHHHLEICSFRLSLELAVKATPGILLEEWVLERELRKAPRKIKDEERKTTIILVADGLFTLALSDGTVQRFALEQD